jgi:gag-polypeptide of LTR copia-type
MPSSSQVSPSSTPRLRLADFGDEDKPPVGPVSSTQKEPRAPELHWSLQKTIDPSKYLTLFGCLPHKLSSTNYVSWMFSVEATLDTIDLVDYVNGKIRTHKSSHTNYPNWRAANALVRSILITNMAEEVAIQMSHLRSAHEIWSEARRLFSGQTMTDFTLTITSLVTTKYIDGEDVAAHIAKMRGFRRDLMLMDRDLEDRLFACFLHISMPPTWNYVFAGLPQMYTSAEVEHRVKDEHSIKANQESVAMAFRAAQTNTNGHEHSHNPGDPYCTNCNKPGHWISGCWSKGGGAEGKGPRQKKRQHKKKNDETERKNKRKGKDRTNEAVHNDSDDESRASNSSYMATSIISHLHFHWILDGGSTTHICKDKSAFSKLASTRGTIGSIQKKGPKLDIHGRGDICVICSVKGRKDRVITLRDILS